MASVGILALIYVVLAQGAMQGILWEGDSRRRLEASMLADTVLAELEAGWLSAGETPEVGESEQEFDDYTVFITTTPVNPVALLGELQQDERIRSRIGSPVDQVNPAGALNDLLPDGSPLLDVLIEVVWTDAQDERKISRRTYALDMATLGPLLEAAGVTGGGSSSQAPLDRPGPLDQAASDEGEDS